MKPELGDEGDKGDARFSPRLLPDIYERAARASQDEALLLTSLRRRCPVSRCGSGNSEGPELSLREGSV